MVNDHILFINPWIYDFAAYDFWVKPLGLLYCARYFEKHGYRCSLIDCVHRDAVHSAKDGKFNTGKFTAEIIEKPDILKQVPRHYRRYGISPEEFRNRLAAIAEQPAAIFFTCIMTYWYPGLRDAVLIAKEVFPDVPFVLSGIYAKLCTDHARDTIPVDHIMTGNAEAQALRLLDSFSQRTRPSYDPFDIRTLDRPAYHLYDSLSSVSMTTSLGCPLHCQYCASSLLQPVFIERAPEHVLKEIDYYINAFSVTDIALYDDALLLHPEQRIIPLLKEIIRRNYGLRFHTPNGLHIREITDELAELAYAAGFKTLRLSFESSHIQRQADSSWKVTNDDFVRALASLKKAGFGNNEIGVYMMIGLPEQAPEEIEASIAFIHDHGVRINTVQYSPIPETAYYNRYLARDLDPVVHNNSIFPFAQTAFEYEQYQKIKNHIRELNARIMERGEGST